MNIAVVDAGGTLEAHVRMDGAWIGRIDISFTNLCLPCLRLSTEDTESPLDVRETVWMSSPNIAVV